MQKWRGICIFIVGKGAYTDRQAYLLAGRESFSAKMERELHICTVGKGAYADKQAYRELHGEGSAHSPDMYSDFV